MMLPKVLPMDALVKQRMTQEAESPPWLLPQAVYIHIPFCAHHCCYCDFAVVAGKDHLADRYLDALGREMGAGQTQDTVHTIHLGGGTPTQLDHRQLERLLRILRQRYILATDGEFAVEANPNKLDDEKLALLATFGVNRLSLGAQSFQPPLLQLLERQHTPTEIEDVVARARRYFPNLSLDLIFGTPGQTLAQWQEDLQRVIALGIPHVSTYGLTYEKGTRLWKQQQRRRVIPLEEEAERTLYATAMDMLTAAGFEHYEISNFAKPGFRSRHNQVYWANYAYFGHGLGAARYSNGVRSVNTRDLDTYLRKTLAGDDPTQQREELPPEERARETAMLHLRRREGILREQFERQTGFALDTLCRRAIARNVERGLLQDTGTQVFLTREGKFLADSVCGDFLVAGV
jgi:oxygen-independent coproporphyrinogen-3 oxidase